MRYGKWIRHFGDHAAWSNATLICKGMAPYGVVALGEVDRIADRLAGREGDAEAWQQEWCAMAEHVEQLGDEAEAKQPNGRRPCPGGHDGGRAAFLMDRSWRPDVADCSGGNRDLGDFFVEGKGITVE